MNFLKSIFKKPVTITFAIIMAIVLGILSTSSMAINLLPNIGFPYLTIQTVYVGASAETIDKNVTSVIEHSMNTLSDIHDVSTYSLDNASLLLLQFDYGTDIDEKEDEINKKLENISLPEGCSKPKIGSIDFNNSSIFSMTVFSENYDLESIQDQLDDLQQDLLGISGVGSIGLKGQAEKEVKISMINGLEMLAGLVISEITKNNSLDIPLGEIESAGNKITINNNSGIKNVEDIKNLTLQYSIDNETLTSLTNIQNILNQIENLNAEDTLKIKDEGRQINELIDRLETSTNEELDQLYSDISMIRTIINLVNNYSSTSLNFLWNNVLKNLLENENFKNLSEAELKQIASDLSLSYDLLKWLQNNSEINPDTGVMFAEEKWQIIINFKDSHSATTIEDSEFANLFYDLDIVSRDVNSENYLAEDELKTFIEFSKNVNIIALNNVINVLKNNQTPSNSEYAALFVLNDYYLPITGETFSLVRSKNFEKNIEVLYAYKINHEHEENGQMVGDPISGDDFIDLYNQIELGQEISFVPTARLIDFIRKLDTTNNSLSFKVSDIADVDIVSNYNSYAYYNSNKAIQIDLYGSSGCNATAIAKEAKNIINKFNQTHDNMQIVMLNNQADFISDSLVNALVSLLVGMFLAIAVIYLFLRKVKSSLIIAVSMPLSILCTMICLYLMGITLNMVSVGGLAVGIGMLVDNSIVVLESITSERSKGKNVLEASIDGVKLVLGSLIGSTITSICVFFPILFINGLTKEVFSDLCWAVILSLTFSLLVAVIVIPTLFCLFYRKEKKDNLKEKEEGKIFTKIKNWYIKILNKLLIHKGVTILTTLGIFVASIGLVFTCNVEFLPSIDQHRIELTINFENSDSALYCQEKTFEAYKLIDENIENIDFIAQSVGTTSAVETSKNGKILVQLQEDAKKSTEVVEDIRNVLTDNNYSQRYEILEIDGVVASLTGGMAGVSVTIYGENVDVLKEISQKISDEVSQKEGVKHVSNNMLDETLSYELKFDFDAIKNYGLDYSIIVQTLRVGLAGYEVATIDIDDKEYTISVSWKDDTIGNYYQSLADLIIGFDSEHNPLTLDQVATIEMKYGRSVIRKSNGLNILEISIETYGIDTNTASRYLQETAKNVLKDYEGYTFQSSGVSYYLTDTFSGLVVALIISFFLLFGVMACLFESLRKPIIIIFSFPFAFTGGFIALAISRVSLNVVSFIGLIMLMGVIINDAIVLNERFDQLREEGLDNKEAVVEGCKQRLRAVLMTTLTTVLALIPMALGLGKGGELMQPLGIVAIGGMTIGTLVTLILIPCAYSLIYRIKFIDNTPKKIKIKKIKVKKAK